MKLEIGKSYIDKEGGIHIMIEELASEKTYPYLDNLGYTYKENGMYHTELSSEMDLVEEYVALVGFKIRLGYSYKNRDGHVCTIIGYNPDSNYPYRDQKDDGYTEEGKFYHTTSCELDLIEEVTLPDATDGVYRTREVVSSNELQEALDAISEAATPAPDHDTYLQFVADTFCDITEIIRCKNADYSPGPDALGNFRSSEEWDVDPFVRCMLDMSDKLQRLKSYVTKGKLDVTSEGVQDSLDDMIGYAVAAKGLLHFKEKS